MRDLFFYCLGLFTIPGLVVLALIILGFRVAWKAQSAKRPSQPAEALQRVARAKADSIGVQ